MIIFFIRYNGPDALRGSGPDIRMIILMGFDGEECGAL